jgi:hypothetical protein
MKSAPASRVSAIDPRIHCEQGPMFPWDKPKMQLPIRLDGSHEAVASFRRVIEG